MLERIFEFLYDPKGKERVSLRVVRSREVQNVEQDAQRPVIVQQIFGLRKHGLSTEVLHVLHQGIERIDTLGWKRQAGQQ